MTQNQQTKWGDILAAGALLYGLYKIFEGDTVVYYLYNRNRVVYIGITYKDRLEQRLDEHERNGLVYNEYDHSSAMSRESALARERKEIRRHMPKYNVHHNYC